MTWLNKSLTPQQQQTKVAALHQVMMKDHFLRNAIITLNSPVFGGDVFPMLWVYLLRLLGRYMVSEEQTAPGCNPSELWVHNSPSAVKPVIFRNELKTSSPCTVHMALSLVAGKSPFPCMSSLNVPLSLRIQGSSRWMEWHCHLQQQDRPAWWGPGVLALADGRKNQEAELWFWRGNHFLLVTQALFWQLNSVKCLCLQREWSVGSDRKKTGCPYFLLFRYTF